MKTIPNITPFLWFDNQAEEAARFYTSVFADSRVDHVSHPGPGVTVVAFSLGGQRFNALDGGPMFMPNPSVSFYVTCESREEVDRVWPQLLEGGTALMPLNKYPWSDWYGWVQDRYGFTWQISLGKLEDTEGQKFVPCLLFSGKRAGRAEEAVNLYTSVFSPSSVKGILLYGQEGPGQAGTVQHAQFKLGQGVYMAMDNPVNADMDFNEALSFVVDCEDQGAVDYFWNSLLSGGGEESMCGWLKDRFGVSWQVVPKILPQLLSHPDPEKAQKAEAALMQMRKIEIDKLL